MINKEEIFKKWGALDLFPPSFYGDLTYDSGWKRVFFGSLKIKDWLIDKGEERESDVKLILSESSNLQCDSTILDDSTFPLNIRWRPDFIGNNLIVFEKRLNSREIYLPIHKLSELGIGRYLTKTDFSPVAGEQAIMTVNPFYNGDIWFSETEKMSEIEEFQLSEFSDNAIDYIIRSLEFLYESPEIFAYTLSNINKRFPCLEDVIEKKFGDKASALLAAREFNVL